MAVTDFRFSPPAVEIPPEVRWVLLRALGPPRAAADLVSEPRRVVRTARDLFLAPRIASRIPRDELSQEIGPEAAADLAGDRVAAAVVEMTLLDLAREVADAAADLDLKAVFLKFAALQLGGRLRPGSRNASDVDILVSAAGARALSEALIARGFEAPELPELDHHLPPLYRPGRGAVEVHKHLPGVHRPGPGGPFLTAADLAELDLLVELPDFGLAPAEEITLAHLLAHALSQHGGQPASYPLTRLLADLSDLGLAGPAGEEAVRQAHRWIAGSLSLREALAAQRLCARLVAGETVFEEGSGDADALALLRHLVAARDADYRRALKLEMLGRRSGRERTLGADLRFLGRTLWPTRGQIDLIYGPPRSAWGYLGRRLARPFDLLRRLALALASRRRLRRTAE